MHRTLKAETARPPEAEHGELSSAASTYGEPSSTTSGPTTALGRCDAELALRALAAPDAGPSAGAGVPRLTSRSESVSRCGTFKMKGRQRFLSQALAGETIAFEEVADGVWALHFYTLELGRFDERDYQLKT